MPFQIIRNDITKVKADAIVNTANPKVMIGGGVDSAIYEAAGKEKLLAARAEIGELRPGEVGVTPAFDLDAKHIIHVSGPWWEGGESNEDEILRQCYDRALSLAFEKGCASIAFPVLATGTYGFPKVIGIQIAVDAFTAFLEEHEMEITLVVFGEESVSISGELVDEVTSFIDAEYEKSAILREYIHPNRIEEPRGRFANVAFRKLEDSAKESVEESEDLFADEDEESGDYGIAPDTITLGSVPMAATSAPASAVPKASAPVSSESLEDALKEIYTDSFEKHLQKLINKKGLKNSEVYATANISKQYFSKLLKGQVKPSKEKMLALAIGLHLNLDETVDFLRIAGYALSPISQTDKVVEYFIAHEDYNVLKIDIVLFDFGLDPLTNNPV